MLPEAIDELPPTFREVVRLRDVEERSTAEVAERLHISKRNAAVRLHRAHRFVRARLVRARFVATAAVQRRAARGGGDHGLPGSRRAGDQSKE